MSHDNGSPAAEWISLGRLAYQTALDTQKNRAALLLQGQDDRQTVYSVEHPPTITIGRNGTFSHITASPEVIEQVGFEIFEVDRGGDVTYHGPGQLVVYPVLHLGPWKNDVGRYVRMLEESIIVALKEVGLKGERIEGYPGVWLGNDKVCAIGASVKRRPSGEFVTSHGLALNVNPALEHFDAIIPCGIADKGVTSIARATQSSEDGSTWEVRVRNAMSDVFQLAFTGAATL